MGDILKDSRFTKYLNDPRYRQIPKHERKVKIDKRFESMFKDGKFKLKYTVDKRGRPINETSTENLRKYYDIEESEHSSSSEDDDEVDSKELLGKAKEIDGDKSSISTGRFVKHPKDDNEVKENIKNDHLVRGKLDRKTKDKLLDLDVDYARGEGVLLTDSSSDEESSENSEESDLEHEWGELDAEAETTNDSTKRLALCNMDWDNIKASDIMVLLSSFLPTGGVIHKITVYPSEYGLQRMQEEEVRGPVELLADKDHNDVIDKEENEEGSTYHMEKLRRYQLNRLKYYYAVVECDSVSTADKLYSECDGLEYESSATRLDMRFIPDDVTFDQEPKEVCTKLPDLRKYTPRLFTTTALQQAKVELTWDATNPNRTEAIRSALTGKIDDLELNEYLASSSAESDLEEDAKVNNASGSDDEEEEDPIQKYKSLLLDIEQKEGQKKNKDMEMEITWGLGVKEKADELVKKKMKKDDKDLTPFEKLMEKKKEKKKQKKLERKNRREEKINSDDDDDDDDSENDAGNSSNDIPSDVDMNDPYFAEEFNKPEFKKPKKKVRKNKQTDDEEDEEETRKKAELELLIDDVDDGKAHFSLKKIQEAETSTKKSKRKRKLKEKAMEQKQALPDFDINLHDERFAALYSSHLYNIDPSDPNFKKTKNMERLVQEKIKRRPADAPPDNTDQPKKSKQDAEISLLVKNIKRKTKSVKGNKA